MEDLFCDLEKDNLDDLELIADLMQKGIGPFIADKSPPIQGTPGCDDGLLPYAPPQTIDAVLGFNGAILEALENDYLDDMMGTGFTLFGGGDRNFGFLNMVLCDTKANPLTNHHRKADNRKRYVDFATSGTNNVFLGSTSIGTVVAVSTDYPEVQPYSGQIIYIENRGAVSRASDQIEDIKLIVQM